MTYRDWDKARSQTNYKRQWQIAVGGRARAQYENRVRGECLEIAMKALKGYANTFTGAPGHAVAVLNEIKARLAELEEETPNAA